METSLIQLKGCENEAFLSFCPIFDHVMRVLPLSLFTLGMIGPQVPLISPSSRSNTLSDRPPDVAGVENTFPRI